MLKSNWASKIYLKAFLELFPLTLINFPPYNKKTYGEITYRFGLASLTVKIVLQFLTYVHIRTLLVSFVWYFLEHILSTFEWNTTKTKGFHFWDTISSTPGPWFVRFLGPSKMQKSQKTHQLNQNKTRGEKCVAILIA